MSRNYDNWERLVDATLKREQLRYIALYCESFSTTASSDFTTDSSLVDFPDSSAITSSTDDDYNLDDPFYIEKTVTSDLLTATGISSSSSVHFIAFKELKAATKDFRPDCIVGTGSFGDVYKGWMNEPTLTAAKPGDGIAVAVKKRNSESYEGRMEWLTEICHLRHLHHPNLVKLVGYCFEEDELLLVYEFLPEGCLYNHLFKRPHESLSWNARIKVAIGAARGLCFLHGLERQLIHGNLSASAILLDREFNAKLTGFGWSVYGPASNEAHVSTRVVGTYGYADPEYVATGHLAAWCDVYGFGVVLLVLLSGRQVFDRARTGVERHLVKWSRPFLTNKRELLKMMDPRLEGQYPLKEAHSAAVLASRCLSLRSEKRPQMTEVLAVLEQLQSPKTRGTRKRITWFLPFAK